MILLVVSLLIANWVIRPVISDDIDGNIVFKNVSTKVNLTDEEAIRIFENFQLKFEKIYNETENEMRKINFLESLKFVELHNQLYEQGETNHRVSINKFGDHAKSELPKVDFDKIISKTNLATTQVYKLDKIVNEDELPTAFDWRLLSKVTKVKDQMKCNCCYAFTAVASIESAIAIQRNLSVDLTVTDGDDHSLDLSEQQIVDCTDAGKYHNKGCDYGYIDDTYQYVIDNGLLSEHDYPYIDQKSLCSPPKNSNRTFIAKFNRLIGHGDRRIKQTVYSQGPVISLINNDGYDFLFYDHGIMKTKNESRGKNYFNHAVVIVGWGQHNGTDYWIVKNSWSEDWGENGFARVGSGVRGIAEYIYYPVIIDTSGGVFDIYNNLLIFIFIVLAILMFCLVIALLIFCCDNRGKFIYRSMVKKNWSKLHRRNKRSAQPDLLRSAQGSRIDRI